MNESYLVSTFEKYEKEGRWDDLFFELNETSEREQDRLGLSFAVSNTNDNSDKNRYRNVLPYDQNRVKLKLFDSEVDSDYINASPIYIPFARRNYILTQGPLPQTSDDFWQMVCEQNARIIIMLSRIVEKNVTKCHSYFPYAETKTIGCRSCICELEEELVRPHYVMRKIRLSLLQPNSGEDPRLVEPSDFVYQTPAPGDRAAQRANRLRAAGRLAETRIVHHFQFTTWPDFGVPECADNFLEFLAHIRRVDATSFTRGKESEKQSDPPVICHCSAGIGRSGAFVIVDSVLAMLERERYQQKLNKEAQHQFSPLAAATCDVDNIGVGVTAKVLTNVEGGDGDDFVPPQKTKKTSSDGERENNCCLSSLVTINDERGESLTMTSKINNSESEETFSIVGGNELNTIDELILYIRRSRMGLIQTPAQLRFCWKAIYDWIKKSPSSWEFDELTNGNNDGGDEAAICCAELLDTDQTLNSSSVSDSAVSTSTTNTINPDVLAGDGDNKTENSTAKKVDNEFRKARVEQMRRRLMDFEKKRATRIGRMRLFVFGGGERRGGGLAMLGVAVTLASAGLAYYYYYYGYHSSSFLTSFIGGKRTISGDEL